MSLHSMSQPAFLVFYLGTISIISLFIYSQRLPPYPTVAIYKMTYDEARHFEREDFLYNYTTNSAINFPCAKWLPQEKRNILFVNFKPIHSLSWWDEEYHMTLNIAKSLMVQGFQVHSIDRGSFDDKRFWEDNSRTFHRIFYMTEGPATDINLIYSFHRNRGHLYCKLKILVPNAQLWDDESLNELTAISHEKQLMLSSPRNVGTPISYYTVLPKKVVSSIERNGASQKDENAALIILKNGNEIDYMKRVAGKLSDALISIHVLLMDNVGLAEFPSHFHVYGDMSKDEMLSLVAKCALFVRCGDAEVLSPLSAIALQLGTVIINVCAEVYNITPHSLEMKMPYLYSVVSDDFDALVNTTKLALKHRFHSRTLVRSGTFDDRICALLEDDSICSCPGETDCRSKFYLRKGTVFNALNESN